MSERACERFLYFYGVTGSALMCCKQHGRYFLCHVMSPAFFAGATPRLVFPVDENVSDSGRFLFCATCEKGQLQIVKKQQRLSSHNWCKLTNMSKIQPTPT